MLRCVCPELCEGLPMAKYKGIVMQDRIAETHRQTKETDVTVELNLDGLGRYEIDTGVGFLDHMLTHLSKHSKIDLVIKAKGDLDVDAHHTVEDIAICLGGCLVKAGDTSFHLSLDRP